MRVFALMILASVFYCHVCEEMSSYNKTQVACHQLRASACSRAIGWDLRCDPEEPKVTARSKATRLGYRSFMAGKFKMNVKKHNTKLSWDAALALCESEGGSLVKIDTKQKEDVIKEKIKIKRNWGRPAYLWLGLRYFKEMKSFAWTDKSPLGYTNWGTGEPSHFYRKLNGRLVREDCVALSGRMFLGTYWNDRTCSKINGFICEIY